MADFKGNRNMTHGVAVEIVPALQYLMWSMIDDDISKKLAMDYLQVFKLKPVTRDGKTCQEVSHSQEQPKRDKKTIVDFGFTPVSEIIFVIDSEKFVTMMLASEY